MQKQYTKQSLAFPATNRLQHWWGLTLLATALFCGATVCADDDLDPASRVARLSYLKGDVYVQPAEDEDRTTDADEWIDAQLNRPLASGDGLSTDGSARAELQMGDANLQMEEQSRLHLLALTDTSAQIQLDQGSINVYLRRDADDQIDVVTRNARIFLREAGSYRITSWDDDVTELQVRDGRAEVRGERQTYPVRSGEQLTLRGTNRLSAEYDDVARMDDFDRWAAARNERPARATSARYVDSDVIGYEDLDDYGDWRYVGEYGYVWMPTHISVGWAPYHFGHWLWVAPWGWTWVDDAPWGFAPFHYGRWAEIDRRWCWVPGPRSVRAVYAPALVAWVGTPSVSVSIGVGSNVGWIPLGPRDVYRPIYRSSERYVRSVNLSNSRLNATEFERDFRRPPHELEYRNRAAAVVVPSQVLQHARPVQGSVVRTDPSRLIVNGRAPEVQADRTSRLGNGRERSMPAISGDNSRAVRPDIGSRVGDAPVRTRPTFSTPSFPRNNEPRAIAPNTPSVNTPRPQRDTPTWNRPTPLEPNRNNERDSRGDRRNQDRGLPRGNTNAPAPSNNPPRERRTSPVEPMRPASPQGAAPQPNLPRNDSNQNNNQNNRGRGRFGEEERR